MLRRVGTAIVAAVALMSVVFVAAAAGHTVRYDSTITAKHKSNGQQPDTFEGTVESEKLRCVRDRRVALRKRMASGSSRLIAVDFTDSLGDWETELMGDARAGTYFAVAGKKVLRKGADHRHVCKRVKSADVVVR